MFEFLGYTLVGPTDGMIVLPKTYLPHIEKAHKLARTLTLAEIEDILSGKAHVHGNPTRKEKKPAPSGGSQADGAMA